MLTKNAFQRLTLVFFGLILALFFTAGATAFSIYTYGSKNYALQADAAIVLGAAVWGDKPSPVFQERINHAIELYKSGYVQTIIFTGGVGDSNEAAEAIVGKRYAIAQGVPQADILTETESRTTQQNLKNAQKVALSHQLTKFIIVSDPLHMKRAVFIAHDLGMNAYSSPTPTTRYRSLNSQLGFLVRETYFYFVYILLRI
ncbi:MAG: YdcF family protein [Aphanothece sp. CMT-3BRIN-NPC111]|jgi:uncharacterized SAM-binding protein YcdF (DUF218 family)|nr:YdcF family protein [Aphanothece sp. CMT-3BRIN-NPC111]